MASSNNSDSSGDELDDPRSQVLTFPMFCGRNSGQNPKFPLLKPKIISYYSVIWDEQNKRRDFAQDDRANLRILLPYDHGIPYDLAAGYAEPVQGDSFLPNPYKPPLARLMAHLVEGRERGIKFERGKKDHRPIPYDFVTKRKVLYRIMVISHNSSNCEDDLEMFAQKYKDTIYLAYHTTDLEFERFCARSDEANRGSYAGLKFKDHLTTFFDYAKGDQNDRRRLKDTFSCVLSAKFGGIKVLYGAGMDAVFNREKAAERQLEAKNFVQFKTVSARFKGKLGELQKKKFRYWWAKSYLSGSHSLIIGYLTDKDQGRTKYVDKVEYIKTSQMTHPKEHLADVDAPWKAANSTGRLGFFLKFLQNNMKDAREDELYKIRWERGSRTYEVTKCPIEEVPTKVIVRKEFMQKFH